MARRLPYGLQEVFPVPQPQPVRVVAVDDEPVILAFVQEHLEKHPGIELVGTGTNGRDALQLTNRLRPDVVVLDVAMPLVNGIEAAARISASYPSIGVLMLTADESPDSLKVALRAGARDYLSKAGEIDRLGDAILQVARRRESSGPDRGPGFIWSFYGTKGGAGTTTLAVNTAVSLARMRYRVLLADLDLLHGDCGFYFDLAPRPVERSLLASLTSLDAIDQERVELAVRKIPVGAGPDAPPLHLLESPGKLIAAGENTERNVTALMEFLASLYDYVVVDLPPGQVFEPGTAPLLDLSERVFLVHNQDLASLRGLLTFAQLLESASFSMNKLSVLVGSVNGMKMDYREFLASKLPSVQSLLEVPNDTEHCLEAVRGGSPLMMVADASPLARFIDELVERALNLPPRKPAPTGLFERLAELFGRAGR
jgi:pilus assembly protein CpaE